MQRFSFKRGLVFVEGQTRWELRRRLATGKLQFESEGGELLKLTDAEVRARWQSHAWLIDETTLGSMKDAVYLAAPRDLSTFREAQQQEARRRLVYLQAIDAGAIPYRPAIWRARIAEVAAEKGDSNPLRDWLANEDIARHLECRKSDAYWLVSNNFLESSRLRVHERIGSRVHRSEIDRFLQRYIFLAEIAELLGVSAPKARRLVEAQGFFSLSGTGPRRCHKAFFERTEQLMAALENLRHSKGGQLGLDGVSPKVEGHSSG